MPLFERPTSTELPGPLVATHYMYADEDLSVRDIFDTLIPDGGLIFFLLEHLGHASGQSVLDAVLTGELFHLWEEGGNIQWTRIWEDESIRESRVKFEAHQQINRLFFLLPMAHRYLKTGDEAWASLWVKWFRIWSEAHPCDEGAVLAAIRNIGTGEVDNLTSTKRIWHDMQMAARLLCLLHSSFMLRRSTAMGEKEWGEVHRAIALHSRLVLAEAGEEHRKHKGHGNHFLQKAQALILTATLFPELCDPVANRRLGETIMAEQMNSDLTLEGANIEGCPSYSHFILNMYAEPYLAIMDNQKASIPGLRESILRQIRFLSRIITPPGLSLCLSDSFSLQDPRSHLIRLSRRLGLPLPDADHGSVLFPESGLGILRKGPWTVYVDYAPKKLWHHHAGKPHFIVFHKEQEILSDSGCSDYGGLAREQWFKTQEAHNSLTVSGPDQVPLDETEKSISLQSFSESSMALVVEFGHGKARWERILSFEGESLVIQDHVQAADAMVVKQFTHGAPHSNFRDLGNGCLEIELNLKKYRYEVEGNPVRTILSIRPSVDSKNRIGLAPCFETMAEGKEVRLVGKFRSIP